MESETRTMKYDANKKNVVVAYLLYIFFGYFEIHRFYLGKGKSAVILLLCVIVGFVLICSQIPPAILAGFFLMAVYGIMIIADVFLTAILTKKYNNNLIDKLTGK